MQTKMSQNPNFGRPSATKINRRLASWQKWREGMQLLAAIKNEIASQTKTETLPTYGNI